MPISVTCPACSASFNVKDEYAGKRAKCPKCSEPLTIPAAAPPIPSAPPVAAPVVARPVVASPVVAARVPAKPTDAEEDSPAKKRRRDEDEEEKPAAKRRRGGDDDEKDDKPKRGRGADADSDDDAPKSRRRRRDDDDDEPKKKNALPLILGIIGGVLLLCGGGCAGLWFGAIAPAIEQAKARVSERQAELNRIEQSNQNLPPGLPAAGVTEENLRKVRLGMTEEQVRKILGSSVSAVESDVTEATAVQADPADALARWRVKLNAGCVRSYRGDFTYQALVAYSARPEAGGTAVATLGSFAGQGMEPIRLVVEVPPPTDSPVTLTADQLSDRQAELKDKTVIIEGKVEFASNAAQGGSITLARSRGKKSVGAAFTAAKWNADWAGKKMQPGDGVTIKGVVGVDPTGVSVLVKDCELLAHTPQSPVKPDDRTPVATLTPDELAVNYAQMKDKWVTVKGQYKSMVGGEGTSVVLVAPNGKSMIVHPPIGTKFTFKTPPQPFDNLEFTGKVVGSERLMILSDSTLLSQSANTEKPTEVTAEDLTAEFDKDANAATKKFEGKLVKVTGTVSAGGNTGAHLGLRGLEVKPPGGKAKAYFVDCLFEGTARDAAKGVKLRDQVTIVGRFSGFKKGTSETYTVTLTTCRLDK